MILYAIFPQGGEKSRAHCTKPQLVLPPLFGGKASVNKLFLDLLKFIRKSHGTRWLLQNLVTPNLVFLRVGNQPLFSCVKRITIYKKKHFPSIPFKQNRDTKATDFTELQFKQLTIQQFCLKLQSAHWTQNNPNTQCFPYFLSVSNDFKYRKVNLLQVLVCFSSMY